KGTFIPYIVHPVAVAGLVAQHGGDEELQIAALLHDVLEDGGPQYEAEIQTFGERVLRVVRACTDGVPDATGEKAAWHERKRAYLEHLWDADDDVLLVSGCDKLHNARAILDDLIASGSDVFNRFNAGWGGALWYYRALAKIFEKRQAVVAGALARTVAEVERLAGE